MKTIVYTKPNCPQCDLTKRDMEILGIEYETIDLTQNPSILESFIKRGFRSAPVVETDQGDSWAGYNQAQIKRLAYA